MGMNFDLHDEELYRRIDEVLHYIWDPIGVRGMPEARDEYTSYIPQVFSMLKANSSEEKLTELLELISVDRMGLEANPKRASEVVTMLKEWKGMLDAKYT